MVNRDIVRHGFGKRSLCILFIVLFLLGPGVLGLLGGAGAQSNVASVAEKEDFNYKQTIGPGETAVYKWDVLNPSNATYDIRVQILQDSTDFTGKLDKASTFQVFSGQTDTVVLKVRSDAEESSDVKMTLVFELTNTETNATVNAYKSAETHLVVTHGVDYHGYFVLDPGWLGLEDNNYTRLLMIILFYLLLAVVTLALLKMIFRKFVGKTKTEVDDIILDIIATPVFILVILYGFLDAIALIDFIPADLAATMNQFFGLAVVLIFIYLAFKLFKGVLIQVGKEFAAKTETEVDDVLIPVIEKIGVVFIAIFGMMGVLSYFGIDLTMAAAGFGVFGLVIAFAAQSSIANFFGGIFILLDRPFKVDDMILINNDYCKVLHIGLRSTRVYDIFNHAIIIMPNDKLANSTVVNLSAPDQAYKVKVTVDIAYGSDPDKFVDIMKDVVMNAPKDVGIIKDNPDRGLWSRLDKMKDSSLEMVVGFWVDDIMKQWSAAGYVRTKLYYLCMEKGIEIPFPQMDVHLKGGEEKK